MARQIAPRVLLYSSDAPRPSVEQGWLTLPDFPARAKYGDVFGDGSHPTTRLCAGAVDLLCCQRDPRAVLDVGTGTGILARIARARGVGFVAGTDIDPHALRVASTLCDLDQHAPRIHLGAEPPDFWGARFDLVVANILEEPLRILAPALVRALTPGGVLLLSGFTHLQTPALRVLYQATQVTFRREARLDEWALLMFECPSGHEHSEE
jgi:ribosomal protein L11 methyltransferase